MKVIIAIIGICLSALTSLSQENKILKLNTLNPPTGIYGTGFMYPEFIEGQVTFKDNAIATAKLNFNLLTSQVHFIDAKGDTLVLAHPESISEVIISDTFSFHKKEFIRKLTHYSSAPNLFVKQNMKYIGKEKKGAYGTYSSTSSANSSSTYSADDQITTYLSADENMIFNVSQEYFICDDSGNFYPAKKSGFFSLGQQHENHLKTYLKSNKINFNKKADLLQLISYIQEIKSPIL